MEYMTEEEAEKRQCPMRVMGACVPVVTERGSLSAHSVVCVASRCMCWREERDDYGEGYADNIEPGRGRCGMVR